MHFQQSFPNYNSGGFPSHNYQNNLGFNQPFKRGIFNNNSRLNSATNFARMPGVHNLSGIGQKGRGIAGLFGKKGFGLSSFLTTSQKFLGTVNQFMPLYHQAKPLFRNARVLMKVARAVKKNPLNDSEEKTAEATEVNSEATSKYDEILDANIEELSQEETTDSNYHKTIKTENIQPPYYANF